LLVTLKFPVLNTLGLSAYPNESLHLKVEVSHHQQMAVIQNTPVFYYGHSFVPAHFSLETMMAGKMIACLERNFQRGRDGAFIKGRDFYDLLWFMQKGIQPLIEKLAQDAKNPYTVSTAVQALAQKCQKSVLKISPLTYFPCLSRDLLLSHGLKISVLTSRDFQNHICKIALPFLGVQFC